MARLMSKVSGHPHKPAGPALVPMGRDRCHKSGSLRERSEGTEDTGRAQDPPNREPRCWTRAPRNRESRQAFLNVMRGARPILLLTFVRERFQFGLCPTF